MADTWYQGQSLGAIGKPRRGGNAVGAESIYEDVGCDLWPECKSCVLPACRYDMTDAELFAALEALTRPQIT